MTTESVEEGSLTAYLRHIKQTLCVPAAEYVPAMGDAMLMLDRAIQMSYQTDPCWLSSSSAAERAVREALEEAAKVAERGCLVPPDGGSPTESEREMCEAIARDIRAVGAPHPARTA